MIPLKERLAGRLMGPLCGAISAHAELIAKAVQALSDGHAVAGSDGALVGCTLGC